MIFVELGSDIFGSPSYLNGGSALKVETRGGVGQTNNRMIIIYLENGSLFFYWNY